MLSAPSSADARPSTPLWAVLAFTFFNSVGGGVVTTGFPFITESAFGFGAGGNYALGLLQGVAYIAGALGAGPVIRRLIARHRRVSERGVLAALMLALAALCALPWVVYAPPNDGNPAGEGAWAVWLLIGGYSALTGVLWPLVESFMSGGRTEGELRSAAGCFNVVWSGALVVAFFAMGPLIRRHPLEIVLSVGGLHLACALLLPRFRSRPGSHPVHLGRAPESYGRLLSVFRIQLATTYLVYSALSPFLPVALDRLNVPAGWRPPAAATWLTARVITFFAMQRWHGWHGSWRTAWVGITVVLTGFVAAVLSVAALAPVERSLGLIGLLAGLAAFGTGMGVVYSAAIYYAMEVGQAEVDAGGAHEALIGVGYAVGPVCGLVAIGAAGSTGVPESAGFGVYMVLLVALLAVAATVASFRRAWRGARHAPAGA